VVHSLPVVRLRTFVSFCSAFSVRSADAATVVVAPRTLRTRLKVNRQKRRSPLSLLSCFHRHRRFSRSTHVHRFVDSTAVSVSRRPLHRHTSVWFSFLLSDTRCRQRRVIHTITAHRQEYFRKSSKSVSDRLYT